MAKKHKISSKRIGQICEWLAERDSEDLEAIAQTTTPSLKKASAIFRLDPDNHYQARVLLQILASLVFSHGKRGRPMSTTKWGEQRLFDLGYHFHLLRQEKPKINFSAAARAIKRRWPKEYANSTETTLRQRMKVAQRYYEGMKESRGQFEKIWRETMERFHKETGINL